MRLHSPPPHANRSGVMLDIRIIRESPTREDRTGQGRRGRAEVDAVLQADARRRR